MKIPHDDMLMKLDMLVTGAALGVLLLRRKLRIPLHVLILGAAAAFVCARTLMAGKSLKPVIMAFTPTLFMCLNLLIARDQKSFERILKIWCWLLFILLCADLATMVLFPSGLYSTEFYTDNWFLGYKTGRMDYTFPLLAMTVYLDIRNNEKLTKTSYIVFFMVLANIARSLATGGTIMIALFFFMVIMLIRSKDPSNSYSRGFIALCSRYELFLIAYAVMFYIMVILPTTPFIQDILVNVLHKSADFSGRVPIWQHCLSAIKEHLLIGRGFLNSVDYLVITHGYFNPHNTIIAYLLIGGFTGLGLLAAYFYFPVRSAVMRSEYFVQVFYIYIILLLGLFSAVLCFSPFFFVLSIIPCCTNNKDNSTALLKKLRLLTK